MPSNNEEEHVSAEAAYLEPYRDAFRTFGAAFDTTLWKSRATQTIRFDVLF